MRKVLLKIHLVMGLAAGLFLIILGLTGSIMAFEGDLDTGFTRASGTSAKGMLCRRAA